MTWKSSNFVKSPGYHFKRKSYKGRQSHSYQLSSAGSGLVPHLDAHVVHRNDGSVQRGQAGLVQRLSHHHFGGHIDEVHTDCFGHKGEGAWSPQVTLYHLQVHTTQAPSFNQGKETPVHAYRWEIYRINTYAYSTTCTESQIYTQCPVYYDLLSMQKWLTGSVMTQLCDLPVMVTTSLAPGFLVLTIGL